MQETVVGNGILKVKGVSPFGAKMLGFLVSPAFGVLALTGVIGWELWRAKKDSDAIKAKKAEAA